MRWVGNEEARHKLGPVLSPKTLGQVGIAAAAGWVAVQLVGGKEARQPGWHAQRRRL